MENKIYRKNKFKEMIERYKDVKDGWVYLALDTEFFKAEGDKIKRLPRKLIVRIQNGSLYMGDLRPGNITPSGLLRNCTLVIEDEDDVDFELHKFLYADGTLCHIRKRKVINF